MSVACETWTISAAQLAGLKRRIQTALDRLPDAAFETLRKTRVKWGVWAAATVPAMGYAGRVVIARFDPEIPGMVFWPEIPLSRN